MTSLTNKSTEEVAGAVIAGFFVLLFVSLLLAAPTAFVCMLALGVLHGAVPAVPALGFIETYAGLLLLSLGWQAVRGVTLEVKS